MQQPNRPTLALLPAIVIGLVNIASVSVIYIAFHDAHRPIGSASIHPPAASTNSGKDAGGTASETPQVGVQTMGSGGDPKNGQSASTGASSTPSVTNNSSKSSSGGGKPSLPVTPVSLIKGPPCKTQVPPAGVCKAILSLNTQKDGNPYWSPSLLAAMKQGVASNSYVQLLGLNPTNIYNSIQVSIKEDTWRGNATHGTIDGTTSAEGQSQATTFTVDWNGSKWIVNDAVLG